MFSHLIWIRIFCIILFLNFKVKSKIVYNTIKHHVSKSTTHQPSVIDKTCLLKYDPGPCRAEIPMYYYEPKEVNCSVFLWGGCQGNGNRFDTKQDCLMTCLSQPGQSKRKPKWCSLSFDYGFCFGAIRRWYYDPLWKVCKKRMYSGCGGNKNNFYTKEQCDAICNFGTGVITSRTKRKDVSKKVIILNPPDATKKRGRNQSDVKITTVFIKTSRYIYNSKLNGSTSSD